VDPRLPRQKSRGCPLRPVLEHTPVPATKNGDEEVVASSDRSHCKESLGQWAVPRSRLDWLTVRIRYRKLTVIAASSESIRTCQRVEAHARLRRMFTHTVGTWLPTGDVADRISAASRNVPGDPGPKVSRGPQMICISNSAYMYTRIPCR